MCAWVTFGQISGTIIYTCMYKLLSSEQGFIALILIAHTYGEIGTVMYPVLFLYVKFG